MSGSIAGTLACALLLGGGAVHEDLDAPEAVARLELVVPAKPRVLLHGTFPVPKGTYPLADRSTPFAVLNHDPAATLVPAQVEIVSRYPTGEADVVEIFAPVDFSPEDKPGTFASFRIVPSTSKQAKAPKVPKIVDRLLARNSRMDFGVRARDVHGNLYWADLSADPSDPGYGSLAILKTGPYIRQRRVYATMVQIGTPSTAGAPLPHLFGVHAYITEKAGQNEVDLDLRVNNGAVSGSRAPDALEEPLGIVYFRTIQLVLPAGWTAVSQVTDPSLGAPRVEGAKAKQVTVIPLVLPFQDGRLHMMGPQAQFERRFVLMPTGAAKNARIPGAPKGPAKAGTRPLADPSFFDPGLAFNARGKDLWSWFDPDTARYFPQRDLLATFDLVSANGVTGRRLLRTRFARELGDLREALATGLAKGYYVVSGSLGWAHPWWVQQQGSRGGDGISTFEGHYSVATASREQIDALSLLHRMNVCRQPQAAYDRTGEPVGYHAWLDADGRIPFEFRLSDGSRMPPFRLPCAGGPPASEQVRAVVETGLRPPYDLGDPFEPDGAVPERADCLLAWMPHDGEHYVRYTKQPKALVWLVNDSMAKDDLILAAETYRLARHESPRAGKADSGGRTLADLEEIARAHPHEGLPVGREDAWGIDAMCAAYSVADPEWRSRNAAWFGRMSKLLLDGAMPSGLVQRFVDDQLFGHARYAATQTFESLFLIHAMRCMNESVFRGVDDDRREDLERLAVQAVDYLFFGPAWGRVANSWQPYPANPTVYLQGPRQAIAVALNDDYATPPFSAKDMDYLPPEALGLGVEWYHPWAALSYAHQITDSAGPAGPPSRYLGGPIDDGKPQKELQDVLVDRQATQSTAGSGLANRYLRRAVDCGKPHKTLRDLIVDFMQQASNPTFDNSANWVGLLGKLQSLQRR